MLNRQSRIWLASGVWFAAVAIIAACSVAVGASVSSSALLFVLCVAPVGVALFIGFGAPPPTVAEVLYALNTENEKKRVRVRD